MSRVALVFALLIPLAGFAPQGQIKNSPPEQPPASDTGSQLTGGQTSKQSTRHVPVVEDLVQLLQARPDLRAALEGAIRTADLKGLGDVDAFLTFLDGLVTSFPTEHQSQMGFGFRYILKQAPGDQLNRDKSFCAWLNKLAEAWGQFLDSHASS